MILDRYPASCAAMQWISRGPMKFHILDSCPYIIYLTSGENIRLLHDRHVSSKLNTTNCSCHTTHPVETIGNVVWWTFPPSTWSLPSPFSPGSVFFSQMKQKYPGLKNEFILFWRVHPEDFFPGWWAEPIFFGEGPVEGGRFRIGSTTVLGWWYMDEYRMLSGGYIF